jgi:hypothetical protein
MALVAPVFLTFTRAQKGTATITVPGDLSAWAMTASVRDYLGQTVPVASKTVGAGIVATYNGSSSTEVVITFDAADLTIAPGARVWGLDRTDVSAPYPIVDASGFQVTNNVGGAYPTLTNLSEYLVAIHGSETVTDADAKFYLQTIPAVESAFQKAIGRELTYKAADVSYLDGRGTPTVAIKRTPVSPTDLAVRVDETGYYGQVADSFGSTTALTIGEDFVLEVDSLKGDGLSYSGILRKINGVWPWQSWRGFQGGNPYLSLRARKCPGCIRVTANCGYQIVPPDVKQAIFDGVTQVRNTAVAGRFMNSVSGEAVSVSWGELKLETELMRVASYAHAVHAYRRGDLLMVGV